MSKIDTTTTPGLSTVEPARRAGFLIFCTRAGDPAYNMGFDEALLLSSAALNSAILRLYGWTEPAATFGYFQKFETVKSLTDLRPLIRRPTGGGIVPHDRDWTYSLAFPPLHEWYSISARESYRRVHEWLHRAFAKMGVETQVAPEALKAVAGQCFVGHEQSDLLWRGRKIAGAAQRRSKDGLLIQGSVQPPPLQLGRDAWHQAMLDTIPGSPDAREATHAEAVRLEILAAELARAKYSQDSFNCKR